jgi:hypothetical protein
MLRGGAAVTFVALAVVALTFAAIVHAAPDEETLGKRLGYPVGNAANWYYDESVRV